MRIPLLTKYSTLTFFTLAAALPATAAPAPEVELRLQNGRPTVFENGKPVVMAAYDSSILWPREKWTSRVDGFIKSGVKVFHLTDWHDKGVYGQSRFWTNEDVYPTTPTPTDEGQTMDWQANYILARVPDARFILRLNAYAPKAWMEKNPGEIQLDSTGKMHEPSWASQKYLSGLRAHYRNIVRYVEAQPWGDRLLGYFILPYGEGLTILSITGGFYDRSPAMNSAWREYLGRKYASDADLQTAWGETGVLRATALVPEDKELRAKIETLPQWPDPAKMRRERDYALLQRELFARYIFTLTDGVKSATTRRVIVGLDAMKQHQLGWQIREAFEGKGLGTKEFSMYLSSGSIDVGSILDGTALDCLVTPADYTARGMGMAFEGEGLADPLVLRGKTLFIENDARTWLANETPDLTDPLGSFMTPAEVRAGLLRNTGSAISRGLHSYWTDIGFRAGYFTDPIIQREIVTNKNVLARATNWPHRETQHAIAVIIDDQSPLRENFSTGFQQLALLRQRVEGLGLAGIPYRIYLLSDMKKGNFPDYRCYLFPNLFKVDDETIALLKRKVFRDGRIAIFGPGTGITDGTTVSAGGAERVLGMPMKLYDQSPSRRVRLLRNSHPAVRDAHMPTLYGDSLMYGPILLPDVSRLPNSGVVALGDAITSFQLNAPGLALKEFGRGASGNGVLGARGSGDYAVVFSAAIPLPPALLRSLARYGGCNVWVNDDVVVTASDTMVSLHTNESGNYTIQLPRRVGKIHDGTTGRLVAQNARELRLTLTAPETRLFFLE